mgnify:CR=1 FL=1
MGRSSHRVGRTASKVAGRAGLAMERRGGSPPRLLDQVRERVRRLRYFSRTEDAYVAGGTTGGQAGGGVNLFHFQFIIHYGAPCFSFSP